MHGSAEIWNGYNWRRFKYDATIFFMTRRSIDLHSATPPGWVEVVMDDFDSFLLDHANCERKASALALSLIVKYPDRQSVIPALIDLAREELEHFQEVYRIVAQRGLTLQRDESDRYVNELLAACRHGRDERFIDRMLIASVIECRGAERFGILAEALPDAEMRQFYQRLHRAEVKHGHQFVRLLLMEFDETRIYQRLDELMALESRVVSQLEFRAALH